MHARLLFLAFPAVVLSACCARPCRPCAPPCPSPCAQAAPAPAPSLEVVSAPESQAQVFLQSTLVRIPGAAAESLLGAPRATTNPSSEILPFARGEELLKQVTADPSATLLQMPTVLVFAGQDASIFTGEDYAEAPHRLADLDPYEAAQKDPAWSGIDLRFVPDILADKAAVSLELAFVIRAVPPKDPKPDLARLQADQIAGRLTVLRIASGNSVVIVASAANANASGDRVLLVVTPRILHGEVAEVHAPQAGG